MKKNIKQPTESKTAEEFTLSEMPEKIIEAHGRTFQEIQEAITNTNINAIKSLGAL